MTDIKKWYSDWYSGEEELTDEEEQSLAELDMMVDKAIATERAKVLGEVEGWANEKFDNEDDVASMIYNQAIEELLAKLNQLKGGK